MCDRQGIQIGPEQMAEAYVVLPLPAKADGISDIYGGELSPVEDMQAGSEQRPQAGGEAVSIHEGAADGALRRGMV